MNLLDLFCDVDDFWQAFEPIWNVHLLESGIRKRRRQTRLTMSEVMTIIVYFHQSNYRTFKAFYTQYVQVHLRAEFPALVSYTRFVELKSRAVVPLLVYLHTQKGTQTGIAFIDSTPLTVCNNRRIHSHRVFPEPLIGRGKTSMGWFYGFKLHLVINDRGELLAFQLSPGNVDDRRPAPELVKGLVGKLFGDKGYIKQALVDQLMDQGLHLITPIRRNMTNRLIPLMDKLLLRKHALIETVNDQLKNISQIEHTRHRSFANFAVNLLAGLIAYCHRPKKPSLNLSDAERRMLPAVI